jgi:diadenylate cyclase
MTSPDSRDDTRNLIIESAFALAGKSGCRHIFVFLDTTAAIDWFATATLPGRDLLVPVIRSSLEAGALANQASCPGIIRNWSGNQSRFSRIKYAFLQGVIDGLITTQERIVCVLGPTGRDNLDTITLHDLAFSWSEEFPFDVQPLIESGFIHTIMAVLDIALDIGALGREGKAVGTIFVIGDAEEVLEHSHQAVFNPFKGYDREERSINRSEVVESLKELARLDGATIITADGHVEAAGRNLDLGSRQLENQHGLGARHRAAAGITVGTTAVSIVVSESTGKVTIFRQGNTIATMEPLISRRLV